MTSCLLCNSIDTKVIAKVESKEIVKRYKKTYKTDFTYLFSNSEIKLIKCNSCDLGFYDPMDAGDEYFYSVLQKAEKNYYRDDKEEYKIAAKIITKDTSVLDVGCGRGEFKKFVPECDFTGLEFSTDAINTGLANGCYILNQTIEAHSELNIGKYDYVTSFQVLEHVPNIASFIDSCAKCVKPGGLLIIAVPSEESYLQFSTNAILNLPPHHISRWTDSALNSIASLIGFNLINIFHDNLDDLHVNSYFTTLIERSLPFKNKSFVKLIDNSINYKIRIQLALLFSKQMVKSCSNPALQGKGQNVTAVFQKAV